MSVDAGRYERGLANLREFTLAGDEDIATHSKVAEQLKEAVEVMIPSCRTHASRARLTPSPSRSG